MKIIILLVAVLISFVSLNSYGQIKPAQSQYLQEKGALINPGFEQGYKGWTITGNCTKSLVSDVPLLNKSLKLTCVSQSFSVKQNADLSDFEGQQGILNAQVKATVGNDVFVRSLSNDVEATRASIIAGDYKAVSIPIVIDATSNGIEYYSNGNVSGEFIIDEVGLRLAPELIQKVGQAHFVGSLTTLENSGCDWISPTSPVDTWNYFPVDNDCLEPIAVGGVSAPPTKTPNFIINNARTDGVYQIILNGNIRANSSNSFSGGLRLTNGVDNSEFTSVSGGSVTTDASSTTFNIRNTQAGNVEFKPQATTSSTGNSVKITSNVFGRQYTISVYFFPDSNANIATQNTSLEEFENILTSDVNSTGVISDLTFSGLTIGKRYRISGQARILFISSTGALVVDIDNGATQIGTIYADSTSSDNNGALITFPSITFTATDTSLTFDATSASGNNILLGNNTKNETFIQLQEDPLEKTILGNFDEIEQVTIPSDETNTNELSAYIASGGTVSNENVDWLNGNCTYTSNRFSCTPKAGVFTVTPNCWANYDGQNTYSAEFRYSISSPTNLQFVVTDKNAGTTGFNLPINVGCSKGNADIADIRGAVIQESSISLKKCQTKFLNSNILVDNSDISDLRFSNLDTSKFYKLSGQVSMVFGSNSTCSVDYSDGTNRIAEVKMAYSGTGSPEDREVVSIHREIFKPTSTTLTANFNEQVNCNLDGNGTTTRTYITLCELPATIIETTDFN